MNLDEAKTPLLRQVFHSDENWELGIEHWSDQTGSDQCSIPNSHPNETWAW